MAPSHADAAASVIGRVRRAIGWWWRAITGNPAGVAVAFGAWLAGFLGSMFALQWFLWDPLSADLQRKLSESVPGDPQPIDVTPFDVILVQVDVSAVAGLVVAAPAVAYFARDWLGRRRPDAAGPIGRGTVLQAILAVLAVVLLAVGLAYEYVVPGLFAASASEGLRWIGPSNPMLQWFEYVLLVGLALGLSVVAPFVAAALARGGVVRPETVVGDATRVGLVLAAVGILFWPVTPFAQALWLAPLLVALALSVGVCRVVAGSDGSRSVP